MPAYQTGIFFELGKFELCLTFKSRQVYYFNSRIQTRKPCCRKETARCCKCSFRSKFANNIPYKYKTSHASKATLQSSKYAGAKHNLTPNQDSKSRVWSQWNSSEAISNHNVGFNYQAFDFRRHSI